MNITNPAQLLTLINEQERLLNLALKAIDAGMTQECKTFRLHAEALQPDIEKYLNMMETRTL